MFQSVTTHLRRCLVGSFAAVLCSTSVLSWQRGRPDHVVLNQPGTQVTDTTIRSGSYANTNFDDQPLITRRSNDPEWERRDAPQVRHPELHSRRRPDRVGDADADGQVGPRSSRGNAAAFGVPRTESFQEAEATWRLRQGSSTWATAGRRCRRTIRRRPSRPAPPARRSRSTSPASSSGPRTASSTRATRACCFLTTRSDAKESYREYYASEDSTVSRRPTLTIVLGSGATPPPPPPTAARAAPSRCCSGTSRRATGRTAQSNIDRVVAFIVSRAPTSSRSTRSCAIRAAASRRSSPTGCAP